MLHLFLTASKKKSRNYFFTTKITPRSPPEWYFSIRAWGWHVGSLGAETGQPWWVRLPGHVSVHPQSFALGHPKKEGCRGHIAVTSCCVCCWHMLALYSALNMFPLLMHVWSRCPRTRSPKAVFLMLGSLLLCHLPKKHALTPSEQSYVAGLTNPVTCILWHNFVALL